MVIIMSHLMVILKSYLQSRALAIYIVWAAMMALGAIVLASSSDLTTDPGPRDLTSSHRPTPPFDDPRFIVGLRQTRGLILLVIILVVLFAPMAIIHFLASRAVRLHRKSLEMSQMEREQAKQMPPPPSKPATVIKKHSTQKPQKVKQQQVSKQKVESKQPKKQPYHQMKVVQSSIDYGVTSVTEPRVIGAGGGVPSSAYSDPPESKSNSARIKSSSKLARSSAPVLKVATVATHAEKTNKTNATLAKAINTRLDGHETKNKTLKIVAKEQELMMDPIVELIKTENSDMGECKTDEFKTQPRGSLETIKTGKITPEKGSNRVKKQMSLIIKGKK